MKETEIQDLDNFVGRLNDKFGRVVRCSLINDAIVGLGDIPCKINNPQIDDYPEDETFVFDEISSEPSEDPEIAVTSFQHNLIFYILDRFREIGNAKDAVVGYAETTILWRVNPKICVENDFETGCRYRVYSRLAVI